MTTRPDSPVGIQMDILVEPLDKGPGQYLASDDAIMQELLCYSSTEVPDSAAVITAAPGGGALLQRNQEILAASDLDDEADDDDDDDDDGDDDGDDDVDDSDDDDEERDDQDAQVAEGGNRRKVRKKLSEKLDVSDDQIVTAFKKNKQGSLHVKIKRSLREMPVQTRSQVLC